MFERAGAGGSSHKDTTITEFIVDAASAITGALTKTGQSGVSVSSPAKVIESRSKLYKQLSELQSHKSMGVLRDDEYVAEKETIMVWNCLASTDCNVTNMYAHIL